MTLPKPTPNMLFSAAVHQMVKDYDAEHTTMANLRLAKIAHDEGYDSVLQLLEADASDSVCHGLCTACLATTDSCEPDAEQNWCEECDRNTVQSSLIIAGLI